MSAADIEERQESLFLRMVESKNSLYAYVSEIILSMPGYVNGAHIKTVCDTIQRFLESDGKRGLIITTPPRHMKSTICSEALPAWFISNNPEREVMIISYDQTQARGMARACRARMDTEWHKKIFPRQIFAVDASDEFMLAGKSNSRANLLALGIGGRATGSGADLLIVDDPVKNPEEAASEVMRTKVYEWFLGVAMTRLSPHGKAIIVMTRWHHDDLIGRVLRDTPESWDILKLPAIDDKGHALWPQRFPIERLTELKKDLGSRVFEAMYQGNPTPAEGGIFKHSWFKTGQRFGERAVRCRYWDKAATANGGDWTVGVLMATENGRFCIEDVQRIQGTSAQVQTLIRRTAERDGKNVRIRMEQEPGSSGVDVIDIYARDILMGYDFRADKVTGPKDVRADTMAAAFENGNVDLLEAPWNREFITELCEFPMGAHDDQVDAASGAFRELTAGARPRIRYI